MISPPLKERGRLFIHPASLLFHEGKYSDPQVVSYERVATSKVFVRDVTMVSAYSVLLFGGGLEVDHEGRAITMDGW